MIRRAPSAVSISQGHCRHGFGELFELGPIHGSVRARALRDDRLGVQIEVAEQAQSALEARIAPVAQFAHHLAHYGVHTLPPTPVDLRRIAMAAQAHVVLGAKALDDGRGLTFGERAWLLGHSRQLTHCLPYGNVFVKVAAVLTMGRKGDTPHK